jgi:hypothetical protein
MRKKPGMNLLIFGTKVAAVKHGAMASNITVMGGNVKNGTEKPPGGDFSSWRRGDLPNINWWPVCTAELRKFITIVSLESHT